MLYYVGPKRVVDEAFESGNAVLMYQASVFVALPDAERDSAHHGYLVQLYVPGMGFVPVDSEIYGVEAEHTDCKCLGDGCNEFRMKHRDPPFKLVKLVKKAV